MSEKRFGYGETDLFEWVEDNGEMISTKECVNKLNEQQATLDMQELRLQQLEELLELSENLNKSYREKLIDMNLKMMSEKCEAFPKQTGVLQKHNFNNKLDIFLTLVLAEKGMYKYNDKELSEMTEKRFGSFENKQEMYDLVEKQAIIIEDLEKENELLKKDNQRQKTLKNKHWREIQARVNGYNRIISSLENRIPHHIVEELRNAPLLDCDYEGVESNE